MGFEGGNSQKLFNFQWEIVYNKLIYVLEQMNIAWGGVEFEPIKYFDGAYSFSDYEVYSGILFADRKVNFFAKKKNLISKDKIIYINIFQSKDSPTLVSIDKGDPSLMYGWQNLLVNSSYERLEYEILSKLTNSLCKD